MISLYKESLQRLESYKKSQPAILHWGCPILHFGNLRRAKIATLGLNPSDKEFLNKYNNELDSINRRFHTLNSLNLDSWDQANTSHIKELIDSCDNYFNHNPYDRWFKKLDFLISGTSKSYYFPSNDVCHLDLFPFATKIKWGALHRSVKNKLIEENADLLIELINRSEIQYLILNGISVVKGFQKAFGIDLNRSRHEAIDLIRTNGDVVKGYFYEFSGYLNTNSINREIQILGYNHNIQSSFGINSKVINALRHWITSKVKL
jgi:hypothetical protein